MVYLQSLSKHYKVFDFDKIVTKLEYALYVQIKKNFRVFLAFARAVAAGFDMDHMAQVISFAECFGASCLM